MESLIFDVDGTLWDAVALVAEGWNDGLQSMGFAPHCTEQSIRPLFGKTMTEIAQVVVPGVPQEQAMEVMDRCMDGEMARLRRDPCHIFYPGVKETLTELHKTHRLFIVSNCQQGYIELLMEKGGLGGLISDFDCFGNTGLPKGQTLRLLCERCNVRDAVYVGDTQGDMEASEQAGLPFVWAAYGFGKTTTALLIERELDRRGMETHTLSMDDYFCPLTERELELFSRNELDLERPSRVDVPFFQEQLGKLLAGEEVELPHYDFKNSVRVFDGRTLRRRPGELVILEGIHALNPEVTGYDGRTTRIYVSVRTRITPRSGHPLHPSKIRLVRRMLRDSTGRGRALSETIAMRERVDRGEQRYIMPFKPRAHGSIDSFYSAELGVYRPLLLDDLERLALPELSDVVEVMRELPDVPADLVPQDSLLREFIGGSTLPY